MALCATNLRSLSETLLKETRVDISMPFILFSSYLLPVLRSLAVGIELEPVAAFLGMCRRVKETLLYLYVICYFSNPIFTLRNKRGKFLSVRNSIDFKAKIGQSHKVSPCDVFKMSDTECKKVHSGCPPPLTTRAHIPKKMTLLLASGT